MLSSTMWLALAIWKVGRNDRVPTVSTDLRNVMCFCSPLLLSQQHQRRGGHGLLARQGEWDTHEADRTHPQPGAKAGQAQPGSAHRQSICRHMNNVKCLFSTTELWVFCYTALWYTYTLALIHPESRLLWNIVFGLLANKAKQEKKIGGIGLKGRCRIIAFIDHLIVYL